ncbi:hypothetical protein JHK82_030462 [Glycine max]|uniref:Uncharacterized protein n=2 Tax=Glycine subgen. Soja TaxID=1462606 RepID=K7LNQ8_SOYBN|nr:hypothetical protein JHK87_030365 [Glycine soja]KAG4988115.1 hypothetical protein JHK85_031098 [Glycine max]KAG5123725.1 hypothetical protein JHK82_030462 [Glycine max]KAG5145141.1 hypothetical protein JHK84_030684 [Glycine max]KAH1158243.1 hypothetical protein GYH30_030470 [Glycine max]
METLWTMNKKKSRYLLLVVFFCRCLGLFCHVRKRREKKVKRHFHAFYLHGHAVKCDFIDVIHAMPFLRGQTKKEKEYRNKLQNRESRLLPNSLIIIGHSLGSLSHLSSSRFFI